jgi:hypothetical protein
MGYWVHGRLDTAIITVSATDASDAAIQAKALELRGTREIVIKCPDYKERSVAELELSLRGGSSPT